MIRAQLLSTRSTNTIGSDFSIFDVQLSSTEKQVLFILNESELVTYRYLICTTCTVSNTRPSIYKSFGMHIVPGNVPVPASSLLRPLALKMSLPPLSYDLRWHSNCNTSFDLADNFLLEGGIASSIHHPSHQPRHCASGDLSQVVIII